MLGSLRKFSNSIFAKILLFIVIIPFVFWGMGPLFTGGNQNIIVEIDNEKFTTTEFTNYINNIVTAEQKIDKNLIDNLLMNFISDKIVTKDVNYFDIKLSDNSLSKIIKNEKLFQKNNKFSRVEYEKFLVNNSLNAVSVELNLSKQEKKGQLLKLISGGIVPPDFLINNVYNKEKQERIIDLINLSNFLNKNIVITNKDIREYYEANKNQYNETYKNINFIKLIPKNLTGNEEYTNLYFEKIDEIDNLIAEGNDLTFIANRFNLKNVVSLKLNNKGYDIKKDKVKELPQILIDKIFRIGEDSQPFIIEFEDKYFVIDVSKTEIIQSPINEKTVQEDIKLNLGKKIKRKLLSEIISKIERNKFTENDFKKLSNDENLNIQKIKIEHKNDNKILKNEIIEQIYKFSQDQIIIVTDLSMKENYLINIKKINNKLIKKDSEEYKKYANLSKSQLANSIYNTYDGYIKNKYNININYQALEGIKSNFK